MSVSRAPSAISTSTAPSFRAPASWSPRPTSPPRVRAEAAVRQSQKMEAVGPAHRRLWRTISTTFCRSSAPISTSPRPTRAPTPRPAERLQNAISAVERGSRLTAQLLAFARRQGPRSALDQSGTALLNDMTDLLRRTLGERVEIESIVSGALWNTLVDPSQWRTRSSTSRSTPATRCPTAAELTIELANAYLDDSYAAQHAEVAAGQYVMLGVSDTGTGMPPEVVARGVSIPSSPPSRKARARASASARSTGFVKQSGGHVRSIASRGSGTTVKIYLPRTRKPQEGLDPVSTAQAAGGDETILVVEDDAGVRAARRRYPERSGLCGAQGRKRRAGPRRDLQRRPASICSSPTW